MQGREEKQKTANFHRFPQRYCNFPSTSGSSVSLRALAPSFRTFLHAYSENSFLHPLIFDGWMKGTFPFSACHYSSFHLPHTVFEAVFTPFHSSNALSPDWRRKGGRPSEPLFVRKRLFSRALLPVWMQAIVNLQGFSSRFPKNKRLN